MSKGGDVSATEQEQTMFHIVLVNPEIPQNTGNIGRLSLGVGARLHLVRPLGFDISEKAVRRAGLDYWKDVDLQIHESIDEFLLWVSGRPTILLSTKSESALSDMVIEPGVVLIFGAETKGVPDVIHNLGPRGYIPMKSVIRSYNLSNSVAIASYFALSKLDPLWN